MMGEILFEAMGNINDEFIVAVADILEKPKAERIAGMRLAIVAAVLVSLLLVACAAGIYFEMYISGKDEHPREKLDEMWLEYDDMGLVLSFNAPIECQLAGFKTNYLPSEPEGKSFHPDGVWLRGVVDETSEEGGSKGAIPYSINLRYVSSDTKLVFGGETEIIKDESKDNLRIVELRADLTDTKYPRMEIANYLLVFDAKNGYLITMFSTLHDMEELEKIAANMEIHVYTETATPFDRNEYEAVMPGRG